LRCRGSRRREGSGVRGQGSGIRRAGGAGEAGEAGGANSSKRSSFRDAN